MALKIETVEQSTFNSLTVQVDTPEGRMFVLVIEDDKGVPIAIDVKVGKAGAHLQAWAIMAARLMTLCLDKGGSLEDVLQEVSGQRAQGGRMNGQTEITSGPEGIAWALMQYKRDRFDAVRKTLGLTDDTIERDGRAPRLAR